MDTYICSKSTKTSIEMILTSVFLLSPVRERKQMDDVRGINCTFGCQNNTNLKTYVIP